MSPCYCLELCIQKDISFLFSLPFWETSIGLIRKYCFIQEAGNLGRRRTHVQQPPPHCWSGARAFQGELQVCTGGGRGPQAGQALSALTVFLNLVSQQSDQHRPGCLQYSWSSVPGLVCSCYFEASSQNCGSLGHGQSLVIMWLTFSILWGFEKQLQNSSQDIT